MTPAEQYVNEYFKDYHFNDPVSEADLRIIVQHAYQAGWESRSEDHSMIIGKTHATAIEYQKLYNNYAEHDRKLNDLLAIHESDLQQIKHYTTSYERKCKEYADLFAQYSALKTENKNLTDNYRYRLLDIQEFKEMDKSNRETIDRLIEENKGMQKTLALYAKNE